MRIWRVRGRNRIRNEFLRKTYQIFGILTELLGILTQIFGIFNYYFTD